MQINNLQKINKMPVGWVKTSLNEILPIFYGKGLPKAKRDESGKYPVYGSSGQIGNHSEAITSKASLIIGRKGSIGAVYHSAMRCWPIDTVYFTEENQNIDLKFFLYLLKGLYLENLDKSTAIPGLSRDDYNSIEVLIAPLKEQKRIVAEIEKQFSRLDEAVENLKRVKSNLKRYKASVLKAAAEGKLTGQWRTENPDVEPASKLLSTILKKNKKKTYELSETQIDALPTTWFAAKMDQLIDYVTSGSRGWAKYYAKKGDLFIRAQNLKNDKLELDDVAYVKLPRRAEGKRTLVQRNDILLTITGANVTKTAIVNFQLKQNVYVNQHIALARPTIPQIAEYLYFWIICPAYGRRSLEKVAYGAGKPGLNLTNIKELIVALPPLEEQKQIVQEINQKFTIAEKLDLQVNRNLKYAEQLRQSILHEAYTGQLVHQNPGDEPAEILLNRIKDERKRKAPELVKQRKKRKRAMASKVKLRAKHDILVVLREAAKPMHPEELFQIAGYKPEEVNQFYADLKTADQKKAISEEKMDNGEVYLKVRK